MVNVPPAISTQQWCWMWVIHSNCTAMGPQTVGRHPVTSGLFAHLLEQIESIVKEKPCALDLRERSHIPHLEQENHLQKYLGSRYVIIPRRAFFFLSKHTRPAE